MICVYSGEAYSHVPSDPVSNTQRGDGWGWGAKEEKKTKLDSNSSFSRSACGVLGILLSDLHVLIQTNPDSKSGEVEGIILTTLFFLRRGNKCTEKSSHLLKITWPGGCSAGL